MYQNEQRIRMKQTGFARLFPGREGLFNGRTSAMNRRRKVQHLPQLYPDYTDKSGTNGFGFEKAEFAVMTPFI